MNTKRNFSSAHASVSEFKPNILIGIGKLSHMLDMSRSTIYNRLKVDGLWHDPDFPQPITVFNGQKKSLRWHLNEVVAWQSAKFQQRALSSKGDQS